MTSEPAPTHVAGPTHDATAPVATGAAPAPKPASTGDPALLHAEYEKLMLAVAHDGLDEKAAIQQLIAFDRAHNNGEISQTGYELLGAMPMAITQANMARVEKQMKAEPVAPLAPAEHGEMHADTSVAPTFGHAGGGPAGAPVAAPAPITAPSAPAIVEATTAAPPPKAAPPPEHVTVAPPTPEQAQHKSTAKGYDYKGRSLDDQAYLANYHHLNGGESLAEKPTQEAEATVLNNIRDNDRKLDPEYVLKLQDYLHVKDNSGAFNTETLRALRDHYHIEDPKVVVNDHTILAGAILTRLVPGTPIVKLGDGYKSASHGSTGHVGLGQKADSMAKVAGYADYDHMHGDFTDLTLLDQYIGRGLPYLASRLALADKFLRQRHPLDEKYPTWKDIAYKKLGWNAKNSQGAYADKAELIEKFGFSGGIAVGAHLHSAGLALDIDPSHNPYVFAGDTVAKDSVNDVMATHLRYAAQLYGGEAMNPGKLVEWSNKYSTEEMFARVDTVSHSLAQYLKLGDTGTDQDIINAFVTNAGFTVAQATAIVPNVRHFAKRGFKDENWNPKKGHDKPLWDEMKRDQAEGLTNQTMDIVVALRDAAGLAWGGSEMSTVENGDFMHWDCRNSGIGAAIHTFAMNNNVDPTLKAAEHDPKNPGK